MSQPYIDASNQSNYIDKGYIVSTDVSYAIYSASTDASLATPFNVGPNDIYVTTQNIGVYMLTGQYDASSSSNTGKIYPIWCSSKYLTNLNVPHNADYAWILYPGYGVQLFSYVEYANSSYITPIYVNTTNSIVILSCAKTTTSNTNGYPSSQYAYNLYGSAASSSNKYYPVLNTASVKVWFRGVEIKTGLS